MFIMMNAARLGVGLQGLAQGEVARQNAVALRQGPPPGPVADRRQGTRGQKADPIIVHPDIRRMLMEAKAYNEAARALILWGALQVDLVRRSQTEEEREAANDLISLLTPVIKGFLTDKGYEVATNAQQIYGGHGYIREWGMEQFVRDARINMIYEGANGIQALDLVGRKLGQNGGRAIQRYFNLLAEEIAEAKAGRGQPRARHRRSRKRSATCRPRRCG